MHELAKFIRDIPDFPKPGIVFKDITPLLRDAGGFRRSVELMEELVAGYEIAAREAEGATQEATAYTAASSSWA